MRNLFFSLFLGILHPTCCVKYTFMHDKMYFHYDYVAMFMFSFWGMHMYVDFSKSTSLKKKKKNYIYERTIGSIKLWKWHFLMININVSIFKRSVTLKRLGSIRLRKRLLFRGEHAFLFLKYLMTLKVVKWTFLFINCIVF